MQLPKRNLILEIRRLATRVWDYLISRLLHLVLVLILRRRPWLQFSFSCAACRYSQFVPTLILVFFIYFVELVPLMFQRKWYRNFLMKGFHLVVLLAAGPGIRDTQVILLLLFCTFFHIFINLLNSYMKFDPWKNMLWYPDGVSSCITVRF